MVYILAEEGNVDAVHQLESLWCGLATRLPMTDAVGPAASRHPQMNRRMLVAHDG